MTERTTSHSGSAGRGHAAHDPKRNGRLTRDEFMRLMSSTDAPITAEECQIAFDEIDRDHDGMVDFAQFRVWWNERFVPPDAMDTL